MKAVVIGLVSASLLVVGCQEKQQVVAKVAGDNISKAQFEAYLKHKHIPVTEEKRAQAALDQYLEREALAKAIEDSQFLDNDLTAAELNEFRKQMLISRYFEKYLNQTVSEDALRNYYAGSPDQFQSKRVNIAHILLRVRPKMSEQEVNVVKTNAYEAYSKLRANEDFAKLAKTYSEDRLSAEKNGELGWIKEEAIDSEFSKIAFSLKEGEFSKPIRTPFGFHIIKQLQAPQIIKQPFEAVKGDIRYQLRAQAKQAEYEKLLKQVKVEKIASNS